MAYARNARMVSSTAALSSPRAAGRLSNVIDDDSLTFALKPAGIRHRAPGIDATTTSRTSPRGLNT